MASPYNEQDELERQALLNEMGRPRGPRRRQPPVYGEAPGLQPGETTPDALTEMPVPPPSVEEPAKTDYSKWGSYGHGALNQDKIDRGHDSPKYQIARTLSNFDPSKGITPEALEALNALGIGTFSGQDDKLFVGGEGMDPRFKGITGSDMVRGFKTGKGTWGGWGSVNPQGPGVAQTQLQRRPLMDGPSSFQGIQSLAPTDTGFFNSLQAQLQKALGGPQAFDREALLKLMGAK